MADPAPRDRKGRCLCGEIKFIARAAGAKISVCHCEMCRRWCGGPLLSVACTGVDFEGDPRPAVLQTSPLAQRASCPKCGSPIFWRLTAEGRYQGTTSVPFGVLDDPAGFSLDREWFIDQKPEAYALEGQSTRECVTQAEAFAMLDAALT